MKARELIFELQNALELGGDDDAYVMLNVDGRWTGIVGTSTDPDTSTIFLDSED
jgi:hypothetical protein